MRDTPDIPPSTDLPRATLGVLFIVVLIVSTLWILRPFLGAIIWATMIVVATWPVMQRLQGWLWGSRKLAVAVMTAVWLLVLVLPLWLATGTIIANAGELVAWSARLDEFTMPPPPDWLRQLPVVGAAAVKAWERVAASQLGDLAATAAPYALTAITWTAGTLQSLGLLMVQFLLTLAVAGVMYLNGERAADALLRFGRQLAGASGERVVMLSGQAIRGVALGVVVTALVQSLLAGIGLWLAGVPHAGVLTALAFILSIAQIGPVPVAAAASGWLYWTGSPGWAMGLLAWCLPIVMLDNVLRPLLIRRGVQLPMLLIISGVIGGLISFGVMGLFMGPVLLAVTYTLAKEWVASGQSETETR